MLPIISTHLQESWSFNVKSAGHWNKWLICYTVIGIGILIAAFKVNGLIAIAEAWIVVALAKTLNGKSECDKNAGKFIDKLADVCKIGVKQEQIEKGYRIQSESERRK